ncbi:YggS family pyridoxal phosphate-dependent enzyme [bacterium]|nr:MAG: YggS family pyridoxal phosphate-dependent enzyme [bacterium]
MVADKLKKLKDEIVEMAVKLGRNPDEITLLAVTKLADEDKIRQAYDCGHRDFGENYVQKILPKMEALPDDIRWHFIGHIQKNKINKILGRFFLVHSVDSEHIAKSMEMRAANKNIVQDILIEVNSSGEIQKNGIPIDEASELAHFIAENCPHLNLLGLMTVAPFTDDRKVIANCFEKVRNLRDELAGEGLKLPHLSMGMTNDWKIALEYGSTILRIGTAIFGE